ncbi:MAG: hypothetical protein DWC05_00015 [Candidatus Poseidoniales archaeon]|nr:MAG: hypothetical protein DWC05_00015 [Candidatus Poseidoniales archaeon]
MGFFATIGRGWEMSKLSMSVVKKDPELMVYMIFAGVMSLACLIGMSIPQFFEMEWAVNADGSFTGAYLGFTFIAYMVLSIVVVFWNCAIVANANIRLTGGDPKFADGVNAALKRLPIIIVWGIIAGTVGLILKFLEGAARSSDNDAMRVLASVIHFLGGLVWWFMTFFMLPHLIIEGKSIGDALKSSKAMFWGTWGENVVSGLGIGLVAFLFGIPIVALTIGLTLVAGPLGLLVGAVLIGLLIAWANAAEQVAVVALYRFSKDGQMPKIYQDQGMMTYTFGNAQTA